MGEGMGAKYQNNFLELCEMCTSAQKKMMFLIMNPMDVL